MPIEFTPIGLALLLSILHLFSKRISKYIEKFHIGITSFSAGIFITIIFLSLLPELIKGVEYTNIFLFMLIGFAVFHISEKYVYQHIKDKKKLMKDLAEIHMFGFYIDHFVIGFLLVLTFLAKGSLGFFVFIPFVLHTISSSFSLEHCDEKAKVKLSRILLSSSTLTGAIIASLLSFNQALFFILFAFSTGAIFYVVVRDMLPKGEGGNTFYFIIGALITLIAIIGVNLL
jgi:zinc transporter ZupT